MKNSLKEVSKHSILDDALFENLVRSTSTDNDRSDEDSVSRRVESSSANKIVMVSLAPFRIDLTITTIESRNRQRNLRFTWVNGGWKRNLSQSVLTINNGDEMKTSAESNKFSYDQLDIILANHLSTYFQEELKKSEPIYMPFERIILERTDINRRLKTFDSITESSSLRKSSSSRELLSKRSVTVRYKGVSVFIEDGDLPKPSGNYVEILQTQAFDRRTDALLNSLQDPSLNLGQKELISSFQIQMMSSTPRENTPVITPTSKSTKSLDTVILIAIVVAALSMFLLAFALYLAFQRRDSSYGTKSSPAKTTSIQGVVSYDKSSSNTPNTSNQVTSPNLGAPTQVIDTHPIIDDNISDYTESIVTDVEAMKAQEKANKIRQKKLMRSANQSQSQNNKAESISAVQISSRFNPRYVNKMDNNNNNMSPVSMNTTPDETNNSYSNGVQKHNNPKAPFQLQQRINGPAQSDNNTMDGMSYVTKDDHSLSSMESYGYSLDGIGDYSTVGGGSTKYGY